MEYVAELAHDLQRLQDSIQTARTLRTGIEPAPVWPDVGSNLDEALQDQALTREAAEKPAESERSIAAEDENPSDSFLQMYPTLPV